MPSITATVASAAGLNRVVVMLTSSYFVWGWAVLTARDAHHPRTFPARFTGRIRPARASFRSTHMLLRATSTAPAPHHRGGFAAPGEGYGRSRTQHVSPALRQLDPERLG